MAKKKQLGNTRQIGGIKKQMAKKVAEQVAPEIRFIVTCILEDLPEALRKAYYNAEKEDTIEQFDPTAVGHTKEEWQSYCIQSASYEGLIVTIYRSGGDITVGETVLNIGGHKYLIRSEEYRSLAQLTPPTLQRLLYLAKVPNY